MDQKIITLAWRQLRPLAFLMAVMVTACLLLSFKAKQVYGDIWQQLGLTREKAVDHVRESFMNGYLHHYGVRNARHLITGNRAALARDLMQFARQELSSESFKKAYELQRRQAKPSQPEFVLRTKEEIRREKIAGTEKSIKETEENIKRMGGDMAKILAPMLDVLRSNLKEYKDPNSKMIELFYQSEAMEMESRQRSYRRDYERWEKEYPADCRMMIHARLQQFIELARTVDFDAELKEVNGKKKFVNHIYEGKSYDWKQIFRAGREVILPAVKFAEEWSEELRMKN